METRMWDRAAVKDNTGQQQRTARTGKRNRSENHNMDEIFGTGEPEQDTRTG
jgi:hypothetical protein